MAYSSPALGVNRLDFLSSGLCKSDTASERSTNIHHQQAQSSQQGQHDYCLQGCFLCAFCLSYHYLGAHFSPQNLNGHLIVWLAMASQTYRGNDVSNQPRAPPSPWLNKV